MDKQQLINYIVENADRRWIQSFIEDVVEFDWGGELKRFDVDTLTRWAKNLGYEEAQSGQSV